MSLESTDNEGRIGNASPGLRFFLFAAVAAALMILDHRGGYLEEIRRYLAAGMYPMQTALDSPVAGRRWLQENLAFRRTLVAENADLRQRLLIDSASLQRLSALDAENRRLRALLDARERVPHKVVVGEVLAVDMDPLRHRVVLNKGGEAGAYEGQALLDDRGVVGQITRDQIYTSEAVLITDPDHAIPVELVRNGLRTIAVGTGDLERLSLPYLTRNADVKTGDLLVTSGLGGAFPAGYPVGTISKVDGSSGDAFLEVTAKPAALLDRLHEVLLVYRQPGEASKVPAVAPPASPAPVTAVKPAPTPTPPPTPAPAPPAEISPAATPPSAPPPGPDAPAPDPTPPPPGEATE